MNAITLTDPLDIARFWSKVDVKRATVCWPWRRSVNTNGYGQFMVTPQFIQRAHRIAWELANQRPVPEGEIIRHSCDNPPCCNPAHLLNGSQFDNVQDAVERGRASGGSTSRPSMLSPSRKVSQDDVDEIRRMHGSVSGRALAQRFGISTAQVSRIANGLRWPYPKGTK